MTDFPIRKYPLSNKLHWRQAEGFWHLFRHEMCIAQLRLCTPAEGGMWLTEIWQFDDFGYHAVDCPEAEGGKILLENWANEAGLA